MRDDIANCLARFWKDFGYYEVSFDKLLWAIQEHLKYGTIETIELEGEIIAFARFNVATDVATILDCVIHPKYRNKNLMRLMLIKGLKKFPYVEYIEYERGFKDSKIRRYEVMEFLGLKKEKV